MTAKIKLNHSEGNGVSLNAPASNPASSDIAFKLPVADGSAGQFMKTDGSGNLAFAAAGGGKTLQFVSVRQESIVSWNTTSFTDITGLTATINGVASGSKIIIDFSLCIGRSHNTHAYFKLVRDSTDLLAYSGANFTFAYYVDSSTAIYDFDILNLRFVDTHGQNAGSNLVYKLQGHNNASTNYVQYLNRRGHDSTQRGGCLMTLTEVAA